MALITISQLEIKKTYLPLMDPEKEGSERGEMMMTTF